MCEYSAGHLCYILISSLNAFTGNTGECKLILQYTYNL